MPLSLFLSGGNGVHRADRGAAHACLVAIVLWCALQLLVVLCLGMVARYNLQSIVLCEIIMAAVGGVLLLRSRSESLPGMLKDRFSPRTSLSRSEKAIVASLTLTTLMVFVRSTSRPIIDFDSLWYHLPCMVTWYQEHSLALMEATGKPAFDLVLRYPYNWEALSSLFFFPFREDFLATIPKIISWLVLGLSVHSLSVRLGARRIHGLAAASLVLSVPFLLFDLNTMRIDIALAAFFCASVYFMITYMQDRSATNLVLVLISYGVLAGIKATGLIYVLLILGISILITVLRRRPVVENGDAWPAGSHLRGLRVAGAVLLGGLLGGFWYLRNWVQVGNPLGMVQVAFGEQIIFPGPVTAEMIRRTALASIFEVTNIDHWKTIGIQALVRLQLPFIVVGLLSLLFPYVLVKARMPERRAQLGGLAALLLASAWIYWNHFGSGSSCFALGRVSPYLGQAFRFGFPCLGLMGVMTALSATTLRIGERATLHAVLICGFAGIIGWVISAAIKTAAFTGDQLHWASGLAHEFVRNPLTGLRLTTSHLAGSGWEILVFGTAYPVGMAVACALIRRSDRKWRPGSAPARYAAMSGLLVLAFLGTWGLREWRDARRKDYYGDVGHYISRNIAPDEKIGYAYSNFRYLFYGKDLDRSVQYVPARTASRTDWFAELLERDITIVCIGPTPGSPKTPAELSMVREFAWLESADSPYERLIGEDINQEPWLYRRTSRGLKRWD
jgi:hypothetical protein